MPCLTQITLLLNNTLYGRKNWGDQLLRYDFSYSSFETIPFKKPQMLCIGDLTELQISQFNNWPFHYRLHFTLCKLGLQWLQVCNTTVLTGNIRNQAPIKPAMLTLPLTVIKINFKNKDYSNKPWYWTCCNACLLNPGYTMPKISLTWSVINSAQQMWTSLASWLHASIHPRVGSPKAQGCLPLPTPLIISRPSDQAFEHRLTPLKLLS